MSYVLNDQEQQMSDELFKQVHPRMHKKAQGGGNAKYRSSMKAFCNFVAKEYRMRNLRNISNRHLAEFAQHRQELGIVDVKTELSAIRKFHSTLENPRYNKLETDNSKLGVENREVIKDGRNVVDRAWTNEEFHNAIKVAQEYGHHDIANVFRIARYGGLRINEITAITKGQIRSALNHGRFIVTHAKGGINRTSYVETEEYRKTLQSVLQNAKGERVFLKHGRNHKQMNTHVQNFIYNHRSKWSDVDAHNVNAVDHPDFRTRKNLTLHGLRHAYAREQYRKNLTEGLTEQNAHKDVAERLGHGRDQVTKIYL